ncbi:hypothetical protein VNO78_17105 [Psophocarpus tetragonolobus]|uniref:tRNA-uridine aminocarboxypropyltransferase n=1 Tax=Psophocarpus tetragonolobus TaxID=3891 RepID=A0AAN9SH09_PSOTE
MSMEAEEGEEATSQRRSICSYCERPSSVCLCHALPIPPMETATEILIIQHPHEARHKLSTTPILTKSLLRASSLTARRLRPGLSPLLDRSPPALFLFPSAAPALHLSALPPARPGLLLIAFDATWQHAREMVRASHDFLSHFATRVSLSVDETLHGGSIYDSELILRKEPFAGCVSTLEAVARALRVLEPNGLQIEDSLLRVLREMVRLQAGFLKPVKPRPNLLKKPALLKQNTEPSHQEETADLLTYKTTIGIILLILLVHSFCSNSTTNYRRTKLYALGSSEDDWTFSSSDITIIGISYQNVVVVHKLPEPPIPKCLNTFLKLKRWIIANV